MKKIILFALLVVVISCKKDNNANVAPLNGKWEFRGISCYCAPVVNTVSTQPGNGNIISFSGNTYTRYVSNNLAKTCTFIIKSEVLQSAAAPVNRIIFDSDTLQKQYFRINGTKLTFFGATPLAADGSEEYYERIR